MHQTASPVPPQTPRLARRHLLLALGVLLLAIALSPLLQWSQLSSEALRQILRAEMTRVSDSVYVLQISPVRLRLFPGAISFDSAYVTTDTIRRAAFPNRPVLRVSARACQLSGIDAWRLIRRQGLYGSLFRCGEVRIGARVASTDSTRTPSATPRNQGLDFLTLQREFKLPAELPVIQIDEVAFPDIRLDLTRQRPALPTQRLALQKFSAHFEDVVIDPQVPALERRPLFSRQIALAAEELAIGSGDETVSFKRMAADLDEGSFTLVGFRVEPTDSAPAWFRRQPYRRPWVSLHADSVRFAGIDLAELIMSGKVITQRIVIGGLDANIETDAALPPRPSSVSAPVSPVHEAAAAAATGVRLEAAAVQLIDGSARYTGHRPGRPATIVSLPNLAFESGNILIDPDLPPAQQRPLLARVLQLNLDGAAYRTGDSLKAMTFGQLRLGVGDSVLVARNVRMGPALTDAAWMRRQKVRQTLGRALVDSVIMRGVDFDQLTLRSTLRAREMSVDGVHVRLEKNMWLPAPPAHAERATPALDSTLADLGVPVRLGLLRAVGNVTYVEHHRGLPDREFRVNRVAVTGKSLAVGAPEAGRTRIPLLGQQLTLLLTDVNRQWGGVRSLAVGRVSANFGDSILSIDSIRVAPHYSPRPRHTSVRLSLDSIRLAGVNFVRLADGHGGRMRQAVVGNASFDITVDEGVREPAPRDAPGTSKPFSGFSLPIEIRDFQVRRGRGQFTRVQPGEAPLVLGIGRIRVAGRAIALHDGVTRPLVEQPLEVQLSDMTLSGPASARAQSATIALGDSSASMRDVTVRTGPEVLAGTRAASGISLDVDSLQVRGIHFADLISGKGIRANRAFAGATQVEVRHASGGKDSVGKAERAPDEKSGLLIELGHLRMPAAHVRYVDVQPDGRQHAYSIRKASVSADSISLNPGASRDRRIRRVTRRASVSAEGIVLDDNPMSTFTVASLHADLADSTAAVHGVYIGPTVSDSLWVSRQAHRTDRIRVQSDSVRLAGLDFDRLLVGDGLWTRHERVFGLDINVYTDKNLKPNPVIEKHSSAQTDVQSITFPFGVDTLSVVDGEVVYHELEVGKAEPGMVSFTAITATITGFTSRGVAGKSPPLRIETHSTLFGMGKLDAYATVPLTASGFDATYHGRLGRMPAVAINQFAEKSLPVTIEGGEFEEVSFSVGSKNGHAVGTIVPIYRDLKVRVHDAKASFFKRVEYSVLTFVAKEFIIRHNNPAKQGQPPRVGTIDHTFAGESIVQFLWFAVRDGIEKSMMK